MRSRKIHKVYKNKSHKNKSHKGYKNKSSKRTKSQRKRQYYVPVFTKQNETESSEDSGTLYEKEKEKHNSGNIIKGMRDFLNKKRGFVL
jgi:hypothetical protein